MNRAFRAARSSGPLRPLGPPRWHRERRWHSDRRALLISTILDHSARLLAGLTLPADVRRGIEWSNAVALFPRLA